VVGAVTDERSFVVYECVLFASYIVYNRWFVPLYDRFCTWFASNLNKCKN
jgi:hypothetical protein